MKTSVTHHYRKIFSDVDKRDIVSLYLLGGAERFIMEEMANRIIGSIVPDDLRAFNLTTAYGSEVDVDEFVAAAHSFPFLSDHRVLVLRELERLRGSWKRLIDYCGNPAPSSVLVMLHYPFDEDGNKLRPARDYGALEAAVRKNGRVIPFERLTHEELVPWVRQRAKQAGVEVDAGVAEALVGSVGDDLFDLRNEITKLSLYVSGRPASLEDLRAVVGSHRVGAIFDLLESLRPGNEGGTLRILSGLIETGAERPAGILYILTRHFLSLWKGKGGLWYGYSGAGARSSQQGGGFAPRELIVWLENLRRTELLMKTSSFPEETLLVGALAHSMRGALLEHPVFEA